MSETTTKQNGRNMSEQAKETVSRVASSAGEVASDAAKHYLQEPAADLFSLAKSYAKDHPDVAACWAFGLGVIVGWKLKP